MREIHLHFVRILNFGTGTVRDKKCVKDMF
jgi:hypothetical protein